jgi:beta-glucosidase
MHYSHLAHASVVQLARKKYAQQAVNWQFSMPSIIEWYAPDGSAPVLAADVGWYWGPCIEGDYPAETKAFYKYELPSFTDEQKAMLKGTCDYIGLNYYYSEGVEPTMPSGVWWQKTYPAGARSLANWIYNRFKLKIIFAEIGIMIQLLIVVFLFEFIRICWSK